MECLTCHAGPCSRSDLVRSRLRGFCSEPPGSFGALVLWLLLPSQCVSPSPPEAASGRRLAAFLVPRWVSFSLPSLHRLRSIYWRPFGVSASSHKASLQSVDSQGVEDWKWTSLLHFRWWHLEMLMCLICLSALGCSGPNRCFLPRLLSSLHFLRCFHVAHWDFLCFAFASAITCLCLKPVLFSPWSSVLHLNFDSGWNERSYFVAMWPCSLLTASSIHLELIISVGIHQLAESSADEVAHRDLAEYLTSSPCRLLSHLQAFLGSIADLQISFRWLPAQSSGFHFGHEIHSHALEASDFKFAGPEDLHLDIRLLASSQVASGGHSFPPLSLFRRCSWGAGALVAFDHSSFESLFAAFELPWSPSPWFSTPQFVLHDRQFLPKAELFAVSLHPTGAADHKTASSIRWCLRPRQSCSQSAQYSN